MVLPLILPIADMPALDPALALPAHPSQQVATSSDRRHTVRTGETVYDIAQRYGVSAAGIASRNQLGPVAMIRPGQQLVIPRATSSASDKATSSSSAKPKRSGATKSYTVRPGDTLVGIAQRHRMSIERLAALNSLDSGQHIHPGQKVRVSGSATAKPTKRATTRSSGGSATGTTTKHTVRDGETLSGIATRYGTTPQRLASLNKRSASSFIHPGQTLKVPSSSAGKSSTSKSPASKPATSTSGGNTFAGRTYPDSIVKAADRNREILRGRSVPSRSETRATIVATAKRHGVDPSLALAISYQESGWDQRQVSVANAIGAMQVIPSSGEWASTMAGRELDLLDAEDNITAGVLILGSLSRQADSKEDAIAGYYQGLASVERNGHYSDTKSYVRNVKALQQRF